MKTMLRTVCVNKEKNYLCVGHEISHEVTSARFDRRFAICW